MAPKSLSVHLLQNLKASSLVYAAHFHQIWCTSVELSQSNLLTWVNFILHKRLHRSHDMKLKGSEKNMILLSNCNVSKVKTKSNLGIKSNLLWLAHALISNHTLAIFQFKTCLTKGHCLHSVMDHQPALLSPAHAEIISRTCSALCNPKTL